MLAAQVHDDVAFAKEFGQRIGVGFDKDGGGLVVTKSRRRLGRTI